MTAVILTIFKEFVDFTSSRDEVSQSKTDVVDETSTEEVVNNKQRIQIFEIELIKLRAQARIVKLKVEVNRLRFDVNTTTIAESFFVFAKNVNVSQNRNANSESTTNEHEIYLQLKFLKFEKLSFYKDFFEEKHIK